MTLPPPNVWLTHDGSAECPLPDGSVAQCYGVSAGRFTCVAMPDDDWTNVTSYRVIRYPEETNDVATD